MWFGTWVQARTQRAADVVRKNAGVTDPDLRAEDPDRLRTFFAAVSLVDATGAAIGVTAICMTEDVAPGLFDVDRA